MSRNVIAGGAAQRAIAGLMSRSSVTSFEDFFPKLGATIPERQTAFPVSSAAFATEGTTRPPETRAKDINPAIAR